MAAWYRCAGSARLSPGGVLPRGRRWASSAWAAVKRGAVASGRMRLPQMPHLPALPRPQLWPGRHNSGGLNEREYSTWNCDMTSDFNAVGAALCLQL